MVRENIGKSRENVENIGNILVNIGTYW